ncbi:MAG: phosphoribosylformylglycinamidine synthase subunit PurL [Ardenticatenaceae bacterium]|nr:phosphoribosylformylglycinamidine synthase subunit PurL [Ardenticatenaceae bacterium]
MPHIFRVEVSPKAGLENGRSYITAAQQLGITGLRQCQSHRLYFLQGELAEEAMQRLAEACLADPVTEMWETRDWRLEIGISLQSPVSSLQFVETAFLPGVTDPPAANLRKTAVLLGINGLQQAATGQRFLLEGDLSEAELRRLATELFANPVIQQVAVNEAIKPPFVVAKTADATVELIDLREADEVELAAISQERRLALNLQEMQAIQAYYVGEGRAATDAELEMLAQTWSEHCVHKTFKAIIDYTGPDGEQQTIHGLLNTYIRAATEKINKPWVRSAFVDNAGIVAFDEGWDLAFKVETHNHPSALEPFGGANTGVGGVVRDVLGVSAKPIANTDVLCFGPPDLADVPEGVLHPRRVAAGVIHGIEDYGNKMGIPTVNGSIHYHEGYTANPLVYCGCLGVLPHGSHPTAVQPGDLIVAIGGRTGRDGLRGATFSSMEMDVETSEIAGTAVQIGNPIMEKQVQEVVLRARDEGLYTALTDCGAGGFSSAVGEMAEGLGAAVQLQEVTLKYPGLRPWEIWLSEAQERMVLAVPEANLARVQEICAGQDVEAIVLGRFVDNGRLTLHYGEQLVGDMDIEFLHDGIPTRRMVAVWEARGEGREARGDDYALRMTHYDGDFKETLLKLLAHPDIRSKEEVVRVFDHEVQGGTAVKPLVGVRNHGPGDATVIVPNLRLETGDWRLGAADKSLVSSPQSPKGVALSNGICPSYSEYDPYRMAWAAVDEALRNVVAVGADPEQVSILDNFCWGNPNLPDRLGALVRCAQGCYEAALAYETPFISGKDSLNNEYVGADGRKHAIPGTLLISALGIVPDVMKTVTMDLKQAGDFLFVVGDTRAELGGSHFRLVGETAAEGNYNPPEPAHEPLARLKALHQAMQAGLVQACHDCAEGGIAVAMAEMCIAGGVGVETQLMRIPRDWHASYSADEVILFAESLTRFLVEVRPEDEAAFREMMGDVPHECVGVVGGAVLRVNGRTGEPLLTATVAELEAAWCGAADLRLTIDDLRLGSSQQATNRKSKIVNRKSPKVLILHANGSNRDDDAALACELAGGVPEIVHMNQLLAGERRLADYHMLVVPGGFSYGDDLGAGVLWALDLQYRFEEEVRAFVANGRPVLGICNGFQTLVKAGLLETQRGKEAEARRITRQLTLTFNERGHFECRWVYLQPNVNSHCLFTQGLDELIYCPVAHGEGRLMVADGETADYLQANNLITLTYAGPVSSPQSPVPYPFNPNGSTLNIAGLTNEAGNVMGLMPHPENHIFPWQHPRHHRGEKGMLGLRLFENGVKNA